VKVLASQLNFEVFYAEHPPKPALENVLNFSLRTESLGNFAICISVEKEWDSFLNVCLTHPG
jgi:hypothetical protein